MEWWHYILWFIVGAVFGPMVVVSLAFMLCMLIFCGMMGWMIMRYGVEALWHWLFPHGIR